MSFRCDDCGAAQVAGTKPVKRVSRIREKTYVGGGHGWEIAKEKALCAPCGDRAAGTPPEKVFV